MGLLEKLQSKIELYRLEQRYARRKHRSSFHAGAQYVDGEYIYNNGPTSPTTGPVTKHSTGGGAWKPPTWGSSGDSRWR